MSSSPPCDDRTTAGAPETACLLPFAMFTSQRRPGFSVTIARFEPGRNAIAHGESKIAIEVVTKAGPAEPGCGPLGCAVELPEPPPHAASISKSPVWTTRNFICDSMLVDLNQAEHLAVRPGKRLAADMGAPNGEQPGMDHAG